MNPFRQTFVLSLVLMMIMVCGVTTQTTNDAATSTIKAIPTTHAATTITGHQSTVKLPSTTVQSTVDLTYECYSNQTIRLVDSDLVKSSKSLIITSAKSRSHVNCTGTKDSGGGFLIEGKDCFNKPLLGGLTSEDNQNIIGGRHFTEFTFECNDHSIPKNGTLITVTVNVSSHIVSATPRPAFPLKPQSPSLELQFTVTDKNDKETSFSDGDEEVLHIKGPAEYYMFLKECIAFNGTSANLSYSNHALYKDFNPVDLAITDKAIDGLKGEITIKVYAFHFVGSSDVTYQCTVLICPNTSCHLQVSGRMRRATSVRSEQVEASVKVHEKYDLTRSTVSSAERTETALFVLVASMTLLASLF